MWDYSDKVKEHFFHPHNVGVIENPDGAGVEGSLACGDALQIMFKLGNDGRIAEAKFQTFGCASAIATASMMTDLMLGKTIEEASKITNQDVIDALDGLPAEKIHCSVMGQEALEAAIAYYHNGGPVDNAELIGRIVCHCFRVTESQVLAAIEEGNLKTVAEVTAACKAGAGCGSCLYDIQDLIYTYQARKEIEEATRKEVENMTNLDRIEKIKDVIETVIRPALQQDGGDIKLIDVDGDVVKVALQGACSGCPMAAMTLKGFVEQQLKERVSESIELEAVSA